MQPNHFVVTSVVDFVFVICARFYPPWLVIRYIIMYDNSNSNVNSNNVTLIYKIRDYAACYWQALKMHAYML